MRRQSFERFVYESVADSVWKNSKMQGQKLHNFANNLSFRALYMDFGQIMKVIICCIIIIIKKLFRVTFCGKAYLSYFLMNLQRDFKRQ